MIIISSNEKYKHNNNVIFVKANFYSTYENILKNDQTVEYSYYYHRQLSENEVIEILEQTDKPIYFDSYVLLDKFMSKKIFEKTILAPFAWKDINKSQANNLLSKVDMYVSINGLTNLEQLDVEKLCQNVYKNKKKWKELETDELHQKITKAIYTTDFRQSNDQIEIIFGIHNMYEISQVQILANNKEVELKYHDRANRLTTKKDMMYYSFKIDCDKINVVSALYCNHKLLVIRENSVKMNRKNLYSFENDKYMTFENGNMIYLPKLSIQSKIKREVKYLKNCKNNNILKKRLLIISTKPFIRSNKILISDRVSFAQDNGEEFYRYLKNKKIKNIYYILSAESPDYPRLKEEGFKIIKQNSLRHMLYLYNYKLLCTSNMSISRFHYFSTKDYQFFADLKTGNNVFLQHGVAYNDLSKVYSEYRVNVDDFVCGAKMEYDFLSNLDFAKNLIFTGAPRFDRLHQKNENDSILVFFTWREYLKSMDSNEKINNFEDTKYFQAINRLLTDQELYDKLQLAGIDLKIYLHPNMQTQTESFKSTSKHQIYDVANGDISELIHTSKMLITDYSSVACDFAYQHKPVIAYQFDRDDFHYETGINLEQNKMILRYTQYEQVKEAILMCIDNNFQLSQTNKQAIDKFFGYRDNKNNERLYKYLADKYL